MICQFSSKINEIASGIVYELHEHDDIHYLIKWNVGKHEHEMKEKKKTVDWWFQKGKFIRH